MRRFTGPTYVASIVTLTLAAALPLGAAQDQKPAEPKLAWQATGTLFEACSCSVPCPCNFRQSPSRGYCYTVYAYRLKRAQYGGVKLDGLVFGGGEADKKPLGFLDSRAIGDRKEALEKLALAVFAKGGPAAGEREFIPAKMAVEQSESKFSVRFGDSGGFDASVILGGDGKSPIIVENNTIWPAHRFIKGKTSFFDYKDPHGNILKFEGVNANLGEFDLKP
jgi:hypothetical protein